MKIAFIVEVDFSRQTLELLIEMKRDVVGVFTLKDALCGFGTLCEESSGL
jgi:methionyl-tRNA formyltransferase